MTNKNKIFSFSLLILFSILFGIEAARAQTVYPVSFNFGSQINFGSEMNGSFTGGTVKVTQGPNGTGNQNFFNNFNNFAVLETMGNYQVLQTDNTNTAVQGRSLTFTFSKFVNIESFIIAAISTGGAGYDKFSFSGLSFESVAPAVGVTATVNSATGASGTAGMHMNAKWTKSIDPVKSFVINFDVVGGRSVDGLFYSMKVSDAVCASGTAAPSLSSTTVFNVCPEEKIDLTSITVSNKPAKAILTWHTATPATTANRVADPSLVDPGTYHAAFYDSIMDCYSGTSGAATTSVTATFVECCNAAGDVAPILSATTISNVCPANKVNLTTLTASNKPANVSISWHTGTPATAANMVSTPTAVDAGIYYATFFDSAKNCFAGEVEGTATTVVNANVHPCVMVEANALINTTSGTTISGIEPLASGGIAPFVYSITNGSSDTACVAPSGFTSLTGAGGTINNLSSSTGQHTVTAPANAGSYFYCIKVCDANSCTVSIHTVNVVASCPAGVVAPVFN